MSSTVMQARVPHVDDRVRLLSPVPETSLARGQVGIVCSAWSGCNTPVFEVEFSDEQHDVLRRLLTIEQIALEESSGLDA